MKILIVDDKKENLYLLETLLKGIGYEVESASNGAEALEKLRSEYFDMIISDILMPVMDGFQFCRKVKADNGLKNIPFVFYTATYTNAKDAEFALKLGADKFIRKPIEPDEFIKIIQGIVEDVEKGKVKLKKPAPEEEKEVFKLYSERLVNKLEKKMLDLEKEITERKRTEEALHKQTYNLGERIKELNCLYSISNLVEKPGILLREIMQGVVDLIPPGWQYPAITCVRIILQGQEYRTKNFKETNWKQTSDIIVHNESIGVMDVFYLEERPESYGGPFLKEERNLINALATQLGEFRERKQGEEALQRAYDELELRVEERTADLKITNEQLQQEITEHKRTEVALSEAKAAAESANKAKSDFLANMSHELRTPLNAIIGFSEMLEDQIFGELNEKQKKYVNNVLTSGYHLLALINDILDLSKVESGKLELELSNVSIKNLLENSLVMIKEKALKHRINLDIDIPKEISELEITADERKIKQIMFNILSNAVKFTPDGGVINVNANCKESEIIISVADTGIGIKPEDQKRIFREFEQLDSSYSKTQEGTGLGLALTKRLVELHGGYIWVESEGEGKGSTFTFAIPIKRNVNNSKN